MRIDRKIHANEKNFLLLYIQANIHKSLGDNRKNICPITFIYFLKLERKISPRVKKPKRVIFVHFEKGATINIEILMWSQCKRFTT